MNFKIVIPARFASSRLPGKPLLEIAGKPMLEHVYHRATESGAQQVVVATDDERIKSVAEGFGAQVCMTSESHLSGSDRVAEVGRQLQWDGQSVVVNLQGDEPLVPPRIIRQVAENLNRYEEASLSTLCVPIDSMEEFTDPNVVKVVRDKNEFALYFSRAPIPAVRSDPNASENPSSQTAYRHIGLYAYRLDYLNIYTRLPRCRLEKMECLEQLRVIFNGDRIHVAEALVTPGPGVDTTDDLAKLRRLFAVVGS
ncbi:MAG: 3-deoxy-manno-octulosonate cytidylyltransferase [Gammaproteobacteria bacterium]|nr:3-deoxy-manno-octulosonate cytidylyltransferase [Gammaproteobacteria bacterium]